MCGLIGYFTNTFGDTDKSVFLDLMLMSQLRGTDSTGVIQLGIGFGAKPTVSHDYDKEAVCSSVFIAERLGFIFAPPKNTTLYGLLGHVRSATRGEVNSNNAHPFENDVVCGMHNGTMHGYFENSSLYKTDSEAIFFNIAKYGIEKGLQVCNAANKSAYALQFYDHKTGDVHFIRNTERQLWIGVSKKLNSYVVASEKAFLKYVEDKYDLNFSRLFLLQPDTLYTLHKLSGPGYSFTEKKLNVKPVVRVPATTTTHYPAVQQGAQQGSFLSHQNNNATGGTTGGTNRTPIVGFPTPKTRKSMSLWTPPGVKLLNIPKDKNKDKKEVASSVVKFPAKERLAAKQKELEDANRPFDSATDNVVVHAPYLTVDPTFWYSVVACGCVYCQSVPSWEERGKCLWDDDETFYCPECSSDPRILPYIKSAYYDSPTRH